MKEFELSAEEIEARIVEGIKDADEGRVHSWEEVKAKLEEIIQANKKAVKSQRTYSPR